MSWTCPYTGIELTTFCAWGDEPVGYLAEGMHSREAILVAALSAYASKDEDHHVLWCDTDDIEYATDIEVSWCWVDRASVEGCEEVFRGSAPGEPGAMLITYISRGGCRLLGEHVPYRRGSTEGSAPR